MTDMDITIQELKQEVKAKKILDKKTKKRMKREEKREKKLKAKQAKKEKKVKKLSEKVGIKGVQPVSGGESAGMGIEWTRRSDVPIDKVELKLDALFEPRGEEIQKRWKEKYGDEADIPREMTRPKVDMKHLERDSTTVPAEGADKKKGFAPKAGKKGKLPFGIPSGNKERRAVSEPAGEMSILDLRKPPEGLWLYQKFGQEKPKIVSLIIMLISLVLYFIPMLFIRIVFFILFKILAVVKGIVKKEGKPAAKKEKKGLLKKKEKAAKT